MNDVYEIMTRAKELKMVVPAFNIPYIPMMESVVEALKERDAFALIAVARLEWVKFESKDQQSIAKEYSRVGDRRFTRLHQDHVPVIDEDNLRVDYLRDIQTALDLGFDSVMVDASRLDFTGNIHATRKVCEIAHRIGVPVEAELGSVMGHESNPEMDYEEIFKKKYGFTKPEEAVDFVRETGVDWLSVAIGSIHGSVSPSTRGNAKIAARLDLEHLSNISEKVAIPLVLHGGSGIPIEYLKKAFHRGISKLNIGADIRKPYEQYRQSSIAKAQEEVQKKVLQIIDDLELSGSATKLGVSN